MHILHTQAIGAQKVQPPDTVSNFNYQQNLIFSYLTISVNSDSAEFKGLWSSSRVTHSYKTIALYSPFSRVFDSGISVRPLPGSSSWDL